MLLCVPFLGGSLDLKSLCVLPGKTCWVVYVDALLLNDGGNVLDALSIAARAALALTRIPKVRVTAVLGKQWRLSRLHNMPGGPFAPGHMQCCETNLSATSSVWGSLP